MLKVNQFTAKGVKTSDFSLPKEMEVKENLNLLAQAVRVSESKTHPGLSKVKTRSDINRTTKKWFRQKGTGRARHGARSAPIFVGGGVAHGPTGVKRSLNLSKNMGKKSLFTAISLKAKKKRVLIVSSISTLKKTKEVQILINKIIKNGSKKNKITFIFSGKNNKIQKLFKNIKNVKTELFRNINARKVFLPEYIVFDKDIFEKDKSKKDK